MDGVVINSEPLYSLADSQFFQKYGKVFHQEEMVLQLAGMSLRQGTALMKEKYGLPGDVEGLLAERQAFVAAAYSANLNYIVGFEGFHKRAVEAGFKTCIATSSNDHLLGIAIERLGLDNKFGKNIFKASDVGNVSKPDPAIYLYAAEKLNADPTKCVVIEDAPKGIQAAKNANMFCIGITTTFTKQHANQADLMVGSFEEIDLAKF
jgi:beta-phosphoglucomutase